MLVKSVAICQVWKPTIVSNINDGKGRVLGILLSKNLL